MACVKICPSKCQRLLYGSLTQCAGALHVDTIHVCSFSWHVQDVGLLRLINFQSEQLNILHTTYTMKEVPKYGVVLSAVYDC